MPRGAAIVAPLLLRNRTGESSESVTRMTRRTHGSPDRHSSLNPSLESTEAVRIVSVGEHSLGTIGEDDLGQRRWMWATELGPTRDTGQTFNYLKALDVEGLSIARSEEHTSELQSRENLVCRLLLEKKNKICGS